jgi:hypothetical protein
MYAAQRPSKSKMEIPSKWMRLAGFFGEVLDEGSDSVRWPWDTT